jgi:AcrR family transcriptional regulator
MAAKNTGTGSKRSRRTSESPEAAEEHREPALGLERIVATAVELLDAEGVDGLTMRGLAGRLGAGVMSLYWHVSNKEDVFDLALDAVLEYRGPTQAAESRSWRAEIIHLLEDWRASMLRHPWSASLLPRRALGPNMLHRLELLSVTLSKAGVAEADLNVAIWSLWNHVMGATITRASFATSNGNPTAEQRLPPRGERYPTIERSGLLSDTDWDGAFRRGLDFLLDGLAPGESNPGKRATAGRKKTT